MPARLERNASALPPQSAERQPRPCIHGAYVSCPIFLDPEGKSSAAEYVCSLLVQKRSSLASYRASEVHSLASSANRKDITSVAYFISWTREICDYSIKRSLVFMGCTSKLRRRPLSRPSAA